jgi:hypothetical protein
MPTNNQSPGGELKAMAPKTERIKVEVTDSIEGETRRFGITLIAPNADFQLSDLLRQRGVVSPLDEELKQAIRVATENYLSGAEALISTLTKVSTAAPKSTSNGRRKERKAIGVSRNSDGGSGLQREPVGTTQRYEVTT